jgi:hypothetical protein
MRRPAASWLAPLSVAVLVLAILVVVAVVTTSDDDPTEPTADPTLAASNTTSAAAMPSESPTPTVPSVDIAKPAKAAAKDGFPVLLPAEVPEGWVATEATYTPGKSGQGSVWTVSFQPPEGGTVVLTQSELALAKAVQRYLGDDAERSGKVDLRKWGTGYWFSYSVAGGAGIAKQLPTDTSVVIAAPDEDTAVTLAKQLLTYEDYDAPEAG